MKRSILFAVILLLALSSAMAQQIESKGIHYSVRSDVPLAVIAAVESDYPGMNIHEHLRSMPITLEELKKRTQNKNTPAFFATPDYYAEITGREYKRTANYTKEGELIFATEQVKNIAVPRAVLITIDREYNGWLMTKNQADRFISSTYNNVFYKVWLKSGRKKQQLTMDATGKILTKKRPEY